MNKQEAIKLVIAAAEHGLTVARYEAFEDGVDDGCPRIARHDLADIFIAIELVKRFEIEGEDK